MDHVRRIAVCYNLSRTYFSYDYGSIEVDCASSVKIMRVPQAISQPFAILHRRILEVICTEPRDRALSVSKGAACLRRLSARIFLTPIKPSPDRDRGAYFGLVGLNLPRPRNGWKCFQHLATQITYMRTALNRSNLNLFSM